MTAGPREKRRVAAGVAGGTARLSWRLRLPLLTALVVAGFGAGFVVYALWPRWPQAAPAADAPHLPIVIAGETFRVPPAAIRMKVQRHPGPHERIDLVYTWPGLTPPTADAHRVAGVADRLFVTVTARDEVAEPAERLRTIYLRFAERQPMVAPDGLALVAFRPDTPYEGEDIAFDQRSPEHFVARCMRPAQQLNAAFCLTERFVGGASVTVRFPRAWLSDWRALADGLDRLIAELRPQGSG